MGVTVLALHGFLGTPTDWGSTFSAGLVTARRLAIDYTGETELSPLNVSWDEWPDAFHEKAKRIAGDSPIVLVGYSQGGRLAMHAWNRHPECFSRLVLLSTHPGWPDEDQVVRTRRRENDEAWARRFESDSWPDVIRDWNSQPVFDGGIGEPQRTESVEARARAAACLRRWSTSGQRDLLKALPRPHDVRWAVGEFDRTYRQLWGPCGLEGRVIEGAGHRLLVDAPVAVASLLDQVIEQVTSSFSSGPSSNR